MKSVVLAESLGVPGGVVALIAILCAIVAAGATFVILYFIGKNKKAKAGDNAENILKDAQSKADEALKKALEEGEKQNNELKKKTERDLDDKRNEVSRLENRVHQLEKNLDTKEENLNKREQALDRREENLDDEKNVLDKKELNLTTKEQQLEDKREEYEQRLDALQEKDKELQEKLNSVCSELEKVAKLTESQAKDILMAKVEEKETKNIALYKEQMEQQAESECKDKAKTMLSNAMEKYAQEVTSDRTTSSVELPSDDMKGRIIGREGRNIKTMEQLFGVTILIDDTPEVLTVSCFDPIRREKAKRTLDSLVKDGRIQPGRIEEVYKNVSDDFEDELKRIGEQTIYKLGLPRMSPGLMPYIGRLKYRTSYGQNVLDHSIQVAYLSSVLASELGLDATMAKRAGLLHDIGKSIDAEQEGSHTQLGGELARKFNEPQPVINAIESHHGDVTKTSLISELVTAADTLSAARPGARSETLETYLKRLTQIEEISKSFDGVAQCYALQSGRDVRVMVVPESVSDEDARVIAVKIKDRIQNEMEYPGQIKVSVIRETRAVETAK